VASNALLRVLPNSWILAPNVDSGEGGRSCGIPDEIRQRVYDPFFTTKDVGKGTGQGLAISHNIIVNKHGGRLDLESQPGVGTTFYVKLPAVPPPHRQQELRDENFVDELMEV